MPSDSSLQAHGIHLKNGKTLASLADCPAHLKDLFTLILSVQSLNSDSFGSRPEGHHLIQSTPAMQYESELKLEADELARKCNDYKRPDDLEEKWVEVQQPIVFYRFNREEEEIYIRNRHHHCFICGKHFPLRSRPLLNNMGQRTYEGKIQGVHGDDKDSEDADVCKAHHNVSNFDMDKLTYLKFEGEGKKIPDLTIGLLSWSDDILHAPATMDDVELKRILAHDLMRPFRHDVLQNLEEEGYLKPLFADPQPKRGAHVRRVNNRTMTFPFAIWEAKRSGANSDPFVQNALKVKKVLEWQRELGTRAKVAWEPLMFHFVSVGSEWKLYACHVQKSSMKAEFLYPFRLLWSGDCANDTEALQLLCLVDIIALWGQFQYKPFAGACVRILKRKSRGTRYRHILKRDLLRHQKTIDARNFRWLQSQGLSTIVSAQFLFNLQRAGTNTSVAELEKQIRQGMRQLSLTNYFIPERDGFIWLLHRKLCGVDLLVVLVDKEGSVRPPLVIFNSSNWNSTEFERIIREEQSRMPKNVKVDFRYDKEKTSVLQKCFAAHNGYCTMPEIQFCAILPLSRKGKTLDSSSGQNYFQPLEKLLGLQTLLDAAGSANEEWCKCQQPDTKHMILCDLADCAVGWYHTECEGLPRNYRAREWICSDCKETPNKLLRISKYDSANFEQETFDASDKRIQRSRSIHRAWKNHNWPEPDKVRHLINHQIPYAIEVETNASKFQDTVGSLERERYVSATRCWAVLKNDPLRTTQIRHRFRAAENS